MIEFLKNWCEEIIVAVIISIIIESILPEGNHKKYVKVVIGIYIIFTILNPILGKINTNIEFENSINLPTIETSSINTNNIQEVYAKGLEQTLKTNIEELGYIVKNVNITFDYNYENIEQINLTIENNNIAEIEKVEIGNKQDTNNKNDNYQELKKYITENYNVHQDKIIIK